jgi:hypothetical protein
MSKFTFVCQEESMPFVHSIQSKRTVEFNAETLDDILNEFEMFLRGAGFHFEGRLDIVNEDEWNEDNDDDEEFQTTQTGSWEWTVNSLMNPPKFRANGCEVCGLDKSMMKSHNCYDDNCPVHAPKSVNASEA